MEIVQEPKVERESERARDRDSWQWQNAMSLQDFNDPRPSSLHSNGKMLGYCCKSVNVGRCVLCLRSIQMSIKRLYHTVCLASKTMADDHNRQCIVSIFVIQNHEHLAKNTFVRCGFPFMLSASFYLHLSLSLCLFLALIHFNPQTAQKLQRMYLFSQTCWQTSSMYFSLSLSVYVCKWTVYFIVDIHKFNVHLNSMPLYFTWLGLAWLSLTWLKWNGMHISQVLCQEDGCQPLKLYKTHSKIRTNSLSNGRISRT